MNKEKKIPSECDQRNIPGITRRGFLKVGAAVAGGVAVTPALQHRSAIGAMTTDVSGKSDYEVDSCCQFCQARCTTKVQVRDGRVVNVYGNPGNEWTMGTMCPKGQSLVELTYSPHRIIYPLKREGNSWKRISYGAALDMVADRILTIKRDFPKDYAHRVVHFAPLWDSHESEIACKAALHLAGFPDTCSPGDTCIGSSSTALSLCLGSGVSSTTLDELKNAQMLLLWGANLSVIYPTYVRWIDEARNNGVEVVYFDPRRTPTSKYCNEQVMPRPGTDGALAMGLVRILIRENLCDREFIASHVNGFEELVSSVEQYTPEKVSEITWVPKDVIVNLARRIGRSKRTILWMGGSLSRYTNSLQTIRALIALQAITGNILGKGRGIMNVRGGKPGGEEIFDEMYSAPKLASKLNFRKVIYNMERERVNLLLLNSSYRRYPDTNKIKEAISKVDFVVYRGFFMDEEAEISHLIIPPVMIFESDGSQYGAQRQVVWRTRAIEPLGEAVPDWQFYTDLGKKICGGTFPDVNSAEDIFELFRKNAPTWAGLTLERLKNSPSGISWPCPSEDHPGTRGDMYTDGRFFTEDGKVDLITKGLGPITWSEPKGSPKEEKKNTAEFPLIFTQGKVVQHWQHTFTNWSGYMAQFSKGNYAQVHPKTALNLNLKNGDWVWVETTLGKLKMRLRISESIMEGVVWMPSHLSPSVPFKGNTGQIVNSIIPYYWDKVSAQFNGFGCRLTKA
ncbi:MAG TPA: molybdopterin-dependent oxidoreductase [Syntrophales bacterium]|nr:molybdopterin-dependent oxidoreductase [Syntrophales bacterium]